MLTFGFLLIHLWFKICICYSILAVKRSQVSNSTLYLLMGLLVSLWVGLLTTDVTDACNDTVDMLILLPAKLVLLILPLLSLLILADEDLE